jgi:transposase
MGSGRWQKNDPNDARSIAIAALRSDRLAVVESDDHGVVLRLLVKRHRDMARLRSNTAAVSTLCSSNSLRAGVGMKISAGNASELLDRIGVVGETIRYRILVARELVDDITRPDEILTASKKRIAMGVQASGTSLTNIVGVGPYGPAIIIGYTKDITRFPTKGRYATYNATAPIEVSSARQHHAPSEPGREPHLEPCHPYRSGDPAATHQRWPHLLPEEDR